VATQAVASYGTQLRLSDSVPLSALTINAVTNTTPILVTTTAPHGIVDVSVVTITGVLGNLGANGTFVAQQTSTTQLRLRNSVGTGAYTSGGSLIRTGTFATIAEMRNLAPIGFTFNMVDVSAHDGSGWGSSIPTEKRGPSMRLDLNLVPAHPTHNVTTGLLFLALNKVRRDWLVVFPGANPVLYFQAWVSEHGAQTPVSDALRATPVVTVDGAMVYAFA
jgi:hypothetical protein